MKPESKFLIYALVDPRTGAIRYIGKSVSGLMRPMQHKDPSSLVRDRNQHKTRWIKKLQRLGLTYQVNVLEYVEKRENLADAEIKWIASERARGANLLNKTDGGEGLLGRAKTPDEIRKIALSNMEAKRKITKEQEAALCKDYLNGSTTYELADRYELERHTVARWLKKNNITIRKKPQASRRKIMTHQVEEMKSLYQAGWSTTELAAKYDTYAPNVSTQLNQMGVKMRTHSEAALNTFKKRAA